jgi:hypothetical protein
MKPDIRRGLGPFLAGIDGEREWVTPERMVECTDGYDRIEDELVSRGFVRVARVGDGTLRLMEMGPLVDYARHRIRLRPDLVRCGSPRCRQCAG